MNKVTVKPSAEEFPELAQMGNVVPVYAQLEADFETPVSAFLKLRIHTPLFESAESTDAMDDGPLWEPSRVGFSPHVRTRSPSNAVARVKRGPGKAMFSRSWND